jgi:hypothetical protein
MYSDNKDHIKRNQYSEIQEYTEKNTGLLLQQKSEKCNITMDNTIIH